MTYICGGLIFLACFQALVLFAVIERSRIERHSLEMKLLAVVNPTAAVHVESMGVEPEGRVSYMDDEAMVEAEKVTNRRGS